MIDVSISLVNDKISGALLIDSYFFDISKYDYNFFLYKNGFVEEKKEYSDNISVSFRLKDSSGAFHIKAFIRDKEQRNVKIFRSEKIMNDV